MEKDYALHFEGNICTIYDNYNKSHEIVKVKMEKRNRSLLISFKYTINITMKPIQLSDCEVIISEEYDERYAMPKRKY
ncbi:hypothetical protein CR513_59478, partial [Mucuna pruriens]